ncbi:hypothetical protein [Halopseudomonas sp.]|uniref:hypothetical protein n=1 Tax=Halopseudomonas sp. TaxID=2901191 RepID=UPI0030017ED0
MSETISYSIPDPYCSGNVIEVFAESGGGCFDFRLVRQDRRVLYCSDVGYGIAAIALRDALDLFTSDDFEVAA